MNLWKNRALQVVGMKRIKPPSSFEGGPVLRDGESI